MGHTNETANVELSQFLGTDKPAWLVDYNGDMAKIDAYAYATKVKADANESAITSLGNRVTTVENDITNTITPALTAAQNNIATLQGNITTINSLIGNGTPTTTDQTIIGAINELHSDVQSLIVTDTITASSAQTLNANGTGTVTFDATKTGYTPIGVVGVNTHDAWIVSYKENVSGNNIVVDYRNYNTSAETFTPDVLVLYVKASI